MRMRERRGRRRCTLRERRVGLTPRLDEETVQSLWQLHMAHQLMGGQVVIEHGPGERALGEAGARALRAFGTEAQVERVAQAPPGPVVRVIEAPDAVLRFSPEAFAAWVARAASERGQAGKSW